MSRNSNKRFQQIGFNRLIKLEWVAYTANLVLTGNDKNEIKSILADYLGSEFPNSDLKVRGALSKTLTLLMKIWINVHKEIEYFRDSGFELLKEFPQEKHRIIHWGMITAAYPFWAIAGAYVGRLIRLQGTIPASQIQRRVKEKYGERETVSRCARYLLRSYIDWGVLTDTAKKGIYEQGNIIAVDDPKLVAWLIEAQLNTLVEKKSLLRALFDTPALFPFQLTNISSDQLLKTSNRLEIVRHGLDDLLVMSKGSKGGHIFNYH